MLLVTTSKAPVTTSVALVPTFELTDSGSLSLPDTRHGSDPTRLSRKPIRIVEHDFNVGCKHLAQTRNEEVAPC